MGRHCQEEALFNPIVYLQTESITLYYTSVEGPITDRITQSQEMLLQQPSLRSSAYLLILLSWKCFKVNIAETFEWWERAHMGIPECLDSILNWTELNFLDQICWYFPDYAELNFPALIYWHFLSSFNRMGFISCHFWLTRTWRRYQPHMQQCHWWTWVTPASGMRSSTATLPRHPLSG